MILEIHLLYRANMVVWPHLLPRTNTCKHYFFYYIWFPGQLYEKIILEIHLQYRANMVVCHICYPEQIYANMIFWLHLIPWAIRWKNDTWDTFAILGKCGSLIAFATLNKYMQTWFFGYIWSPGQLCEKMIPEIHLLPWTNVWKHKFCFGGQLCARITFVLHLLQWAKSYKTVFF